MIAIIASFLIYKIKQAKKILRKETREVKDVLDKTFNNLREEIKKKIELFDSQPGFSEKEKEVYEKLKEAVDNSKKSIQKEIDDVEKELK